MISPTKKECIITKEQGFKDFDLAYAYESMARAHAAAGNKAECINFLQKAREVGDLVGDKENKEYFDGDLETEPWFGLRSE